MIKLENLHDQSLKEILDEAKRKIEYLNPEWTYKGESDPGLTLVELFVWLKFVQHEYLNKISPLVTVKFLKLMGITQRKNQGSRALLEISEVEKETKIPKNTKWCADGMIFENEKIRYLTCAGILSVEFKNSENQTEIEYYKFDGIRRFFLFGEKLKPNGTGEFLINFDSPLPKNKLISLYFEIFNPSGLTRNPIKDTDESFVPPAKIIWEYWGSQNGRKQWCKLKIKDRTHNFLFSGIVDLKIENKHESSEDAYPIKITLVKSDYDFPPQIKKILTNVFEVTQKNTVCERTVFKKSQIKIKKDNKGTVYACAKLSEHLSLYGENLLYTGKNNAWVPKFNFRVEKDFNSGNVYIKFSDTAFLDNLQDIDKALMLVSYDKKIENKIIIGSGTGFAPQMLDVNFKETPLYKSFKIIVGEERDSEIFFETWQRVDDFFSSGKFDKHFVYEENIKTLAFGDHTNGALPRAGEKNIRLCSLAFTEGEASNIKKGMINSVKKSKNKILKQAWIRQITPAAGGRGHEPEESMRRRSIDMFSKVNRVVTLDDYKKIVLDTPGILFKSVKILPQDIKNLIDPSQCGGGTVVTIAVHCGNSLKLSKSCKKTIINRLEKYRLLGTGIKITGPELVKINIKGKFAISSEFKAEKHEIENEIYEFFKMLNLEMGTPFHYDELFGKIDNLPDISYIQSLTVSPYGAHVSVDAASGSMSVAPNTIYRLGKFDLNYTLDVRDR